MGFDFVFTESFVWEFDYVKWYDLFITHYRVLRRHFIFLEGTTSSMSFISLAMCVILSAQ